MYTFPKEMKEALEDCGASFVYYQNIEGKGVPVLASGGFCRNTGMPREHVLDWLRRGLFERMCPDDVGIVSKVSDEFLRHEGPYDVIFRCRLSANEPQEYSLIHGLGSWQTMPDGTELAVIAYANLSATIDTIREKTEAYGLFQKDRFYRDFLTELPNTNYMHQFGGEKAAQIRSKGRTPMLVYSDVESMQSYNNQYGLEEGDALLRLIAASLKEYFPTSLVTRGADDHFIMLADVDDQEELAHRLDLVNIRIKQLAKGNTGGIRSGICPAEDEAAVGRAIDHAKHALKRINTNLNQKVRFFSARLDEAYWRSRYIVENIDRAVENGWIKVYYHALYRLESQKIAAFEALARWVDPVRGIISPAEFIPALQKYHLLYKLDLYMFEQVCREVRIRKDNNLPLIPVSVNFSRQDFDHADVVDRMNEIYERSGASACVDKSYFIVEITEQELAADPESCQLQLRKISENGYRIWLDDFGSGYSSFNMFSKFRFGLIKYDMEMAFCGAALYARYDREASLAKHNAEMLLQELNYALSQRQLNGVETEAPEGQMPQILLEGQAVIGVLSVEKLGLELPIIENWDYEKLKASPCRYSGSLEEGNLILLGHNYTSHFGRLKELDAGSEIVFFDLEGKEHTFSIAKTEILKPNQVEELESSPYPLTIFTCTPSGQSRFVVYCEKNEGTVN